MKSIHKICLIGLAAITGVAQAQTPPAAQPRSLKVSELGPAVSGNLIAGTQTTAAYDFDSAPGTNDGADLPVYVDAAWSALNSGDPIVDADAGTNGDQAATYGKDAFAAINEGLIAANPGAPVIVNGGVYNETVYMLPAQRLLITGADTGGSVTIDSVLAAAGATIEIQGNAMLILPSGTMAADLTGTGSLVKSGSANQLLLGGTNTYSGGTTINEGRVNFSGAGSLGTGDVAITSSGQVFVTNNLTNNFTIEGNGWPEAAGELGAIRFNNSIITGDVTVGPAGARIVSRGGSGIIEGDLIGSAALEINEVDAPNNGNVVHRGDGSGYTGMLTITNGRFTMDAALGGSVVVEDGATIAGEGAIAGDLQLGSNTGLGCGIAIDPTTPEMLSADTITLEGLLTTISINVAATPGVPIPVMTYASGLTDNSSAATLNEAFAATALRSTVSDNAGTLELVAAVLSSTWTAVTNDAWQIGGPDANWTSADTFFFNGDTVLFDDSADALFSGTVTVEGNPQPAGMTFANTTAKPYTLAGGAISGTGGLTKNGDGDLTFTNNQAYSGDLVVNDGNVFLDANAGLSGAIVVNGGSFMINADTRNVQAFTVNTGGTLITSDINFLVLNHGTAVADSMVFTVDGGTWICDGGHDARIGSVVLANGGIWTSDRAVTAYDVLVANVDSGPATIAVTGTGAATMNGTGGIHLQGVQNFAVEDTTGDSAADLDVSLIISGPGFTGGDAGGINKTGAGNMFLSGLNTYSGATTVTTGPPAMDVIVESIEIDGTTVTIAFSGGNADVYTSPDLENWTELQLNVAPATFAETGATDPERYYLLLPAGSPAP